MPEVRTVQGIARLLQAAFELTRPNRMLAAVTKRQNNDRMVDIDVE